MHRIQFSTRQYKRKQHCILARMAMWMLSFSKPCVIPLSETFMMLVWAMHCAVLLVGLRTTATLIVFLLCSHNRVLLILRLTKLSQCRSGFPAQEYSASLGGHTTCLLASNSRFWASTNLFDHFSSIATAVTTQHNLHFTVIHSLAPSPKCVFPLRWFTRRTFFFSTFLGCALALPLQRGIFQSHFYILLFSTFIKDLSP